MTMIKGTGRIDWAIEHSEKYRNKYKLHNEGRVPIFQPKTIIKYGEDIFEVKWNKLIEIAYDNFGAIYHHVQTNKGLDKEKARSASEYIYFLKDIAFYAENNSDVMENVVIPALINWSLLDQFKVQKEFDFKPITSFRNGSIHPTDVDHRRRTLGDKLKRITNL